ncbi:MAG: SDR family oxidoreductase [Burkholderiales bacterium]
MRILVLGAGGFIGGHAAAALRAAGHDVVAGRIDYTRALAPEDWLPALQGMQAVVNAVGIIRERGSRTFEALHDAAPRALFDACVSAGVRRVIQISALGADAAASSRFHLTKRSADDYLAGLDLEWTIVQPSIVFGEGGASARLFALLATLPVTPLPGAGGQRVQPIHVADLAAAITRLIESPLNLKLPAVGPREIALREWLCLLRTQLGLGPARFIAIPLWAVPVEGETLQMLERGNTASPALITKVLGRPPRAPERFVDPGEGKLLANRAKLDWLLPLLRASIALVWIVSGVVSLGLYPVEESLAMLQRAGLTGAFARLALYGSALLDIALGVATLFAGKKILWELQIALILGYSAIISVFLPELWLHPFGPVLKNLPMLAALVVLHELTGRR